MKSIRNARIQPIQPSLSPSWGVVIQSMEGDIGCVALIVGVGCMVLVAWCWLHGVGCMVLVAWCWLHGVGCVVLVV
jgi:hypothetical protein